VLAAKGRDKKVAQLTDLAVKERRCKKREETK